VKEDSVLDSRARLRLTAVTGTVASSGASTGRPEPSVVASP